MSRQTVTVADAAAIMALTVAVSISPVSHPDMDRLIDQRNQADAHDRAQQSQADEKRRLEREELRAARGRRQLTITDMMGKFRVPD